MGFVRAASAAFKAWLESQQATSGGPVLPKSPMGQAISYALSQWEALCVYCTDGDLNIGNNVSERALRRIAVGRGNWLFCGSDSGGSTAAILFSFIASCELRDVLGAHRRDDDQPIGAVAAGALKTRHRCRRLRPRLRLFPLLSAPVGPKVLPDAPAAAEPTQWQRRRQAGAGSLVPGQGCRARALLSGQGQRPCSASSSPRSARPFTSAGDVGGQFFYD